MALYKFLSAVTLSSVGPLILPYYVSSPCSEMHWYQLVKYVTRWFLYPSRKTYWRQYNVFCESYFFKVFLPRYMPLREISFFFLIALTSVPLGFIFLKTSSLVICSVYCILYVNIYPRLICDLSKIKLTCRRIDIM